MMKRFALPLFLLLVTSAFSQTTYTTTSDACGGKSSQFCTMPISASPDNGVTQIVFDSRGSYPRANMYIGGWAIGPVFPGTLSGFVAGFPCSNPRLTNCGPDGTHADFNGVGSFESDDSSISGSFQFHAYYVAICSGRGCGGTLGWHYRILAGSTVSQN